MAELIKAIAENVEAVHIVLFALGIICFVIELFEPGTGIFAGVGAVLMILDIFVLADTLAQGLLLFAAVAIIIVVFVIVLIVLASRGVLPGNLILKHDTGNEDGYVATAEHKLSVGDVGVTETGLRPAGKAVFGELHEDVVSDGEFIDAGTKVRVIELNGNRIVVRSDEN